MQLMIPDGRIAVHPSFRIYKIAALVLLALASTLSAKAQQSQAAGEHPAQYLALPEAVETGVQQYQSIQAKRSYLHASEALTRNARNEYLPNVIAAVQQAYGTVNGQFGPLGAVGVLGVASAGPSYSDQRWNAAFGALYIVSANWEVFTFGRVRSRIDLAKAQVHRDSADLEQEEFVQRVRISGAYLNLLVAQQFLRNGRSNLERAEAVQRTVRARTRTGLNPGVDSSLANAEVSRARLSLIELRTNEQQVRNQLAQLLNVPPTEFVLDSTLLGKSPQQLDAGVAVADNPQVKFYQARIEQATQAARVASRSVLPGISLFGVYQARGSGFDYNYTPEFPDRYSSRYSDGVDPSRYNYVAGISFSWNLISPIKVRQQARAQQFVAEGYRHEYNQVRVQLEDQLILADQRLANGLQSLQEAPQQYNAASDAYTQKNVLYKNGLTTIVDLQQSMYALNRAEIDQSVAYVNVWQALLLKAAASGDFTLFINQAH
ncbi:TolC family protein [Parachryseolinea silvisoli]|uniref:TolC family protein n=1 Tax=Parachryseolinea silvisoli TaxID=2873601 RepID=UPI0022659233|nr:TolC family protein [Parachryseolinea silvisoli]MCD9019856.1 TolC family protein [Parachryseolinea silvisoli]